MFHLIRFVWILALLSVPSLRASDSEIEIAADQLLSAGAAGFAMAVIDRDGVRWSEARGFADVAEQKPMSVETIMNIASISKTVTGTSLMMLVEQGKLDLDRDINDYLSFTVRHPAHPETAITTRQLLTHSSAIQDRKDIYSSETVYFRGGDNPIPLGDFVQAYLTVDGRFYDPSNFAEYPPGTEKDYSNVAYGLVGYLVEVISGQPLNRFSAENIFQPLGMHSTGWMLSEIDREEHAMLYEWVGDERTTFGLYGLATWPDGGLRTNVTDLGKFFAAIIGGGQFQGTRILQESTVKTMLTPQFSTGHVLEVVEDGENQQQAITWVYRTLSDGSTVAGHSGGDPGVSTHAGHC
jgi:CubicO group peptidase (beta-lactamase class C family)